MKANFTDEAACLASYHEPFGADAEYGMNNAYSATSVEFSIDTRDYGLTCSYRFAAGNFSIGQGYVRAIVGGSYQQLDGFQSRQSFLDFANAGIPGLWGLVTNTRGLGTFDINGDAFGYRVGLAYEIPTIALRAMVLYNSKYDYDDLNGFQDNTGFGATDPGIARSPITMATEIPQSIEVRLQSGVTESMLIYANFKWQQWTKLDVIDISGGISPVSAADSSFVRSSLSGRLHCQRRRRLSLQRESSPVWPVSAGTVERPPSQALKRTHTHLQQVFQSSRWKTSP